MVDSSEMATESARKWFKDNEISVDEQKISFLSQLLDEFYDIGYANGSDKES